MKILGIERERRAEVVVLNGFSADAGQSDLLDFAARCHARGPLSKIALVHGGPRPQRILSEKLEHRGLPRPLIPAPMDTLDL